MDKKVRFVVFQECGSIILRLPLLYQLKLKVDCANNNLQDNCGKAVPCHIVMGKKTENLCETALFTNEEDLWVRKWGTIKKIKGKIKTNKVEDFYE